MNSHEHDVPPLEQDLLDLLVDDELNDAQRRELLERLERRPDGWRRCALAFLEAQSWKKELRRAIHEPAERLVLATSERLVSQQVPTVPAANRSTKPVAGRSPYGGRWSMVLAVAAGFLVALVVSNQIRPGRWSEQPADPPVVGQAGLAQTGPSAALSSPGTKNPWQLVTLTADDSRGNRQPIRLPAREDSRLDQSWWQASPTMIPDEVLQALKDSGHEIQHSRQFMPVPMPDGRKLVVPVDEIDVDYVGNGQYQ